MAEIEITSKRLPPEIRRKMRLRLALVGCIFGAMAFLEFWGMVSTQSAWWGLAFGVSGVVYTVAAFFCFRLYFHLR